MKQINLNQNLSPNGEYFRVLKHLQKVAHLYRIAEDKQEKVLYASELRKWGFLNANNNSGSWVYVV